MRMRMKIIPTITVVQMETDGNNILSKAEEAEEEEEKRNNEEERSKGKRDLDVDYDALPPATKKLKPSENALLVYGDDDDDESNHERPRRARLRPGTSERLRKEDVQKRLQRQKNGDNANH